MQMNFLEGSIHLDCKKQVVLISRASNSSEQKLLRMRELSMLIEHAPILPMLHLLVF